MKLTKEQIQFIDNYLIKNKVKYWDMRLELLDHIVSAVEAKMTNERISFDEALLNVHRGFGNQYIKGSVADKDVLTEAIYQSNIGFEKFTKNKQKEISTKYRNAILLEVNSLFRKPSFYVEIVVLLFAVLLLNSYSLKIAAFGAILLLYTPCIIAIFNSLKDKFSRKSIHLNQVYIFSFIILSIFNLTFQFLNMNDSEGGLAFKIVLILILLTYPFGRANANVYFKEYKKYKTYYTEYIS